MTFIAHGNGGVDGTLVTTSDTGSGHAWNTVEADTDDRFEYTTDSYSGGMGYRYSTIGASVGARAIATHAAMPEVWNRAYLKVPAIDATTRMFALRDGVGGFQKCHVSFNSSEQLRLNNGDFTVAYTSPALTTDVWYRIEFWYSAVLLQGRLWIYPAAAEAPFADSGIWALTSTGGSAQVAAIYVGGQSAETNRPSATGMIKLDEMTLFHNQSFDPTTLGTSRRGLLGVS